VMWPGVTGALSISGCTCDSDQVSCSRGRELPQGELPLTPRGQKRVRIRSAHVHRSLPERAIRSGAPGHSRHRRVAFTKLEIRSLAWQIDS
jgi:hypothetical protein